MAAKSAKYSSVRRKNMRIELLEDRRLLSASLSVIQPLLVFNAVKNSSASQTEIVSLLDTGDQPINFGAGALSIVSDPASPADTASRSRPFLNICDSG